MQLPLGNAASTLTSTSDASAIPEAKSPANVSLPLRTGVVPAIIKSSGKPPLSLGVGTATTTSPITTGGGPLRRRSDVRFGSKADITGRLGKVRLTPKSGHRNRHVYHFRRDNSSS